MPEIWEEQLHKAQFLSTSTLFSAAFNVPTPGRYDYDNTIAAQNVVVIELFPGTIYWIRTITVGGNISEQDYLGAIVTFPQLTVRRQSNPNQGVLRFPIPLNKYINAADCNTWIVNDNLRDNLTLSLGGTFIQLPSMIGVATLRINVALTIYGFNDQKFAAAFRGKVCG